MQNEEGRQAWIDLAKFLGVLFVLAAHAELRIPFITDFGFLFYVPIFFVVAGYTYHERKESLFCFIKRKAQRLLLPYFAYSLFLYLFFFIKDHLLSGSFGMGVWKPLLGILYARNSLYPPGYPENTDFMTVLNSPLWFLPALFISFVLFELGIRIGRKNRRMQTAYLLCCVFLGLLFHYTSEVLLPWSLETAFILQTLIAFGYWLRQKQFPEIKKENKIPCVIIIFVFVVAVLFNGEMNLSIGEFGRSLFAGTFNAAVSSAIVLWICYLCRRHIRQGLQLLGQSSLCIMALHMFVFMFIKSGFNVIKPDVMSGNGFLADVVKILMICMTLVILTITNLFFSKDRKKQL